MRDLTDELADRLEYHLNQLCDEKACVTPEHAYARKLIEQARRRVKFNFDPPQPMTVYVPVPDPREHYWGRRG